MQKNITTPGMNNVIGNRGNCKVSDDTNDQKNDVPCIRSTKERIAIHFNLFDINPQHVLLYLGNDASEDVGHREPQKNIDVAGYPNHKRIL